jgi:hypothetical protein
MATIEINENTVVRSLVRKGTNAERQNVTLAQGELGFVTDLGPSTFLKDEVQTNPGRLFIGNNNAGGSVTGNKYLGNTSNNDVTSLNAQPGDLIFYSDNGTLYARNLISGTGTDLLNSEDFDALSSGIIIGKGLTTSGDATIVDLAGDPTVATNPLVWDGNSINIGEISLSTIADIDEYTVLANATITSGPPTATIVGENSVLGRTGSEALKGVTYDQILSNAQDPTVSGLTVTGMEGSDTRYVQVDSAGLLSASSQSAVFAFIDGVTVYNPVANAQATGMSADNWVTWGGDSSIPAGAKNVIIQCYLDLAQGNWDRLVDVKGKVASSLDTLGYVIATAEADSKYRGAGQMNLAVQSIIPCGANGEFQYTVNVTAADGNRTTYVTGWGQQPRGGTGTGVPNINSGVLIQAVGYTL